MTGNMSYLIDYVGGNPKGGKITGKSTIRTEAVNTACYAQNKVLVVKPQNKTPYEAIFQGRTPTIKFMRPFGCLVPFEIPKDHLDKFDGKRLMRQEQTNEPMFADPKSSHDDESKPSSDDGKKVDEDPKKESECNDQEKERVMLNSN
ncbi:hypothetical protein Tco_1282424 [Tanacetum coccineum]